MITGTYQPAIDQSESPGSTQMSSNWLSPSRQLLESLSLATVNSNALLVCLLLEGIGSFAQVNLMYQLIISSCIFDKFP